MAPTVGEVVFVDTNVLLIATDERRAGHREARELLAGSGARGVHLSASGQVFREYLAVATRAVEENGLGVGGSAAVANLEKFLRFLHLCDETEQVARLLRRLALKHGIRGRRLHDANIVATMLTHGVRSLLTANGRDFASFDEIEVLGLREGWESAGRDD